MNYAEPVLVLGASGPVGHFLLPRLVAGGAGVLAVSRKPPRAAAAGVTWIEHDLDRGPAPVEPGALVSAGPLEHAFAQARAAARLGRLVALSSAGIGYKLDSADPVERDRMQRLKATESGLIALCRERRITLTLLRPTLLYGGGGSPGDERLRRLATAFRMLPVAGGGLRQPVHADDLARVMITALERDAAAAGVFELGGGETLDYPGMLRRIGNASGRRVRVVRVPLWLMKTALGIAHALGCLSDIRPVMLARQRIDLVVDDTPAREVLDWDPRPFEP